MAPAGVPRKPIRSRGFRTKRDAQAALNELLHDLGKGTFVATDRITVAEYLASWAEALPTQGLRPRTVASYTVAASGTTLTELHGVGPITAALILGHVGDPARFRTRDQFASYNATAPIEVRADLGSATASILEGTEP